MCVCARACIEIHLCDGCLDASCFQGLFVSSEAASLVLHNFCIYHVSPPGLEVGNLLKLHLRELQFPLICTFGFYDSPNIIDMSIPFCEREPWYNGPYQPLPAEYWQNMSHPYLTPSVVHGYGTPHTTGMSFTPSMLNEPATPTFVPETQLSDRESPIEVVNLEKTVSNTEGTRKRSSWTKVEDEVLARSFVTISDDPIIGNDQKADAF
ncbi:hypothetical protein ZIOFF_049031 [Zingiber officinale]|uniref:Uncharacterized protein n=1 Tax=Zingiber officinale TaxID=94328 RepID=A0A8J5KUS9_ZINOF|nr:hypothetical protein ZIOFF_049031 [Zingiber officinale]